MHWEGKTALKRTTLLATLFAAAALAGCTNVGGTPTTAPTPPPTETSNTGSTGSPSTVELDIAKYKAKPCDVLTPTQVTQLGNVKEPTTREGAAGPICKWSGKELLDDSTYDIAIGTALAYDTALANSRQHPVFIETTIQGVRTFTSSTTDDTRTCTTVVDAGKSGSLLVTVNVARNKVPAQKPSAEAQRVAALAIENLRG